MWRVNGNFERRQADRGPVSPGQCYKYYCYSAGTPMYSSAPAMSHALKELVGHVDPLLFRHFRLEQGPMSFIYHPSAPWASRNQTGAFIAKRGLLIVLYRLWMDWRWGAYRLIGRFGFMPSVLWTLENFVKEQVEGGSYASASEVIRDGLRLLEEDQQRRQGVIDRRPHGASGPISRHVPSASPSTHTLPMAARIRRSVGNPTFAVMRRTWRFFPSRIVSLIHAVGIFAR